MLTKKLPICYNKFFAACVLILGIILYHVLPAFARFLRFFLKNHPVPIDSQGFAHVNTTKTTKSALLRSAGRRYHDYIKGKEQTAAGQAAP